MLAILSDGAQKATFAKYHAPVFRSLKVLNLHRGLDLKRNQHSFTPLRDTPATRKRRLQKRLQEISDRSEQELVAIMKSIEKVKDTFRINKP